MTEEPDVFDKSMIEFLHSGCALLVGTVASTGLPHAGRGFGLTVVDADGARVRLLVAAKDTTTLDNLQPGALVAITTASVRTLHSVQMKGRVVCVQAATAVDAAKREQYISDFTNDIHRTDGDPIDMLLLWTDQEIAACEVEVEEWFDQTPGPSAGSRMGSTPG